MINVPEKCTLVLIICAMCHCNSPKTLEVYLKEKEMIQGKKQTKSFFEILRVTFYKNTDKLAKLICFWCDQAPAQCLLTPSHPAMRLYTFSTSHLRRTFWWIISFCKHFRHKLICIPCTDSDQSLSNFIWVENNSSY